MAKFIANEKYIAILTLCKLIRTLIQYQAEILKCFYKVWPLKKLEGFRYRLGITFFASPLFSCVGNLRPS